MTPIIAGLIAVLALALVSQALFSIGLMLYAWDRPERLRATGGPAERVAPQRSFAILLPARDEPAVIGHTIARVWATDYPSELMEVIVICQADDTATIAAARETIARLGTPRVTLAIYDEPPFNKPHALEVGLAHATADVVGIFDAEDDVHPEIFDVINSTMVTENVRVVQGGVQLMNFADHWFSVFNCLEYFFYFKSRLHFNARVGMIPLGGNTVFFGRDLLERVGGWDLACLTEDADIGLRLSALGEPIRVVHESRFATREETPHTVRALVKQRTRWHQGFLQVLSKGDWRRLPGRGRQLLALLTFTQPLLDAATLATLPLTPLAFLVLKLPVAVAILSLLPLYAIVLQMLVNVAGVFLFARDFQQRLPWWVVARMPFTYLPYQWVLSVSALRATLRHIRGRREWEKTEHLGAHRGSVPVALPARDAVPADRVPVPVEAYR